MYQMFLSFYFDDKTNFGIMPNVMLNVFQRLTSQLYLQQFLINLLLKFFYKLSTLGFVLERRNTYMFLERVLIWSNKKDNPIPIQSLKLSVRF